MNTRPRNPASCVLTLFALALCFHPQTAAADDVPFQAVVIATSPDDAMGISWSKDLSWAQKDAISVCNKYDDGRDGCGITLTLSQSHDECIAAYQGNEGQLFWATSAKSSEADRSARDDCEQASEACRKVAAVCNR